MKRTILFLTAALVAFFGAKAQTAKKTAATDNRSLLWRVEKQGQKPSYVFGTMHMICKDDYVWTPAMKQSLAQSDAVCFEMNLSDPSVPMQVTMGLMDTSGKKLSEYFTPDQYKVLAQYMKDSLQLDVEMFARFRPFILESLMMMNMGGCDSTLSYETEILTVAQKAKKPVDGLETVSDQISLINEMPADSMTMEIMDAIQHPEKAAAEYTGMVREYKKQDLPALYNVMLNAPGMSDMKGAFLDTRNKRWISRMSSQMAGKSVFFAVGAGHLWGDNGVINLLRKQGYTVTPVK